MRSLFALLISLVIGPVAPAGQAVKNRSLTVAVQPSAEPRAPASGWHQDTSSTALESELARIDEIAADPDAKLLLLHAMAAELGTHRNRLILLKKQTGESFGRIFVSQLRARGNDDETILKKVQKLRQSFREGGGGPEAEAGFPRPIVYVSATMDRNSAGTYTSLTPEFGIDTRLAAFVVGLPIYRVSAAQADRTGIRDAYVAAFVRRQTGRNELGASLTIGFPTGDRDRGLGAGKVTADLNGAIQRRFARMRPFVTAGFTNSVFNNVGYQRPFISNGNAFYVSGGADLRLHRRLVVGGGGFALRAIGSHEVLNSMPGPVQAGPTGPRMPGGPHMPPGMTGQMPGSPAQQPQMPPEGGSGVAARVRAEELNDHGASAWASLALHPTVALNFTVARSVPYSLTTVRVGLAFDLSRLWPVRRRLSTAP